MRNSMVLLLGGAMLSACGYVPARKPETAAVPIPVSDTVKYTGPTTAQAFSDSSVTVFDLDTPDASMTPISEMPPGSPPPQATKDPSVTVYPFDGGAAVPAPSGNAPRLMPPSAARDDFHSPPPPGTVIADPDPGDDMSVFAPPVDVTDNQNAPIARVYFPQEGATLSMDARQVVAHTAKSWAPGTILRVEGHSGTLSAPISDPEKRRQASLEESTQRALAVSRELISNGVPASAIQTVAWGNARPALAMPGVDVEAASRRVEIFSKTTAP